MAATPDIYKKENWYCRGKPNVIVEEMFDDLKTFTFDKPECFPFRTNRWTLEEWMVTPVNKKQLEYKEFKWT